MKFMLLVVCTLALGAQELPSSFELVENTRYAFTPGEIAQLRVLAGQVLLKESTTLRVKTTQGEFLLVNATAKIHRQGVILLSGQLYRIRANNGQIRLNLEEPSHQDFFSTYFEPIKNIFSGSGSFGTVQVNLQ